MLLLLGPAARAQPGPTDEAPFQHRLRPLSYGRRYWDAPLDSLQAVLAGQRSDTARLRTLIHIADIATTKASLQELVALTARLHRPEHQAYRALWAAYQLEGKAVAQGLDSVQQAIRQFEALHRPTFFLLGIIRVYYNTLNQQEEKRAFYARKLAEYQQRGASAMDLAMCYHGLGGYYGQQGDYNQAISYYLTAAELFRPSSYHWYYNELGVIGGLYAEWGNETRALHYLKQAIAWRTAHKRNPESTTRRIASIYLHQQRFSLALRYADQALRPSFATNIVPAELQAFGLVLKSQILLAQGCPAQALPLLRRAQQVQDSLQIPFRSNSGVFELAAAWAQYYTTQGQGRRAEAYWLAAYAQAQQSRATPSRLAYLRELARFYQQQGQPAPAARYSLAAAGLADTLERAQSASHVAQYEVQQADRAQQVRINALQASQQQAAARARRQRWVLGAVLTVLVLIGGLVFVLWRGNRRQQRANALLSQQKTELQAQRDQTTQALTELRATQAQLIQKEKMASLGELTAGIAHEIQNPLNFVTNFSEVSAELVAELQQELAGGDLAEAHALAADLVQNLSKITQHGQRASGIVRGMLEHARQSTGERAPLELNTLCDEYLRLAYHGLRAKNTSFHAELKTDFAPSLPLVEGVGAELGRVLLNLFDNAFYAVQQRQQSGELSYVPTVEVSTQQVGQQVEVRIRDNGTGMSESVQAKIFQPFFTTKPTGEGTGLGLSLSHDIIAQGHGGSLRVESQAGQGSTFHICLPALPEAQQVGVRERLSAGLPGGNGQRKATR